MPLGAILFDLDHIWDKESPPLKSDVSEILELLHTAVWNEFSAAKTGRLEQRLNEQPRDRG
jgi:hypothetical protein